MKRIIKIGVKVILALLFLEFLGTAMMMIQEKYYTENISIFEIRNRLLGMTSKESLPFFLAQPNVTFSNYPGKEHEGVEYINKHGYRGEELDINKKSGVKRILFLGESTTFGFGVKNNQDTYVSLLINELNKVAPTEGLNAGLLAGTSSEVLSHYLFRYRYYNADKVIIKVGMNELDLDLYNSNFQPDYTHFRRIDFNIEELDFKGKLMLQSRFLSFTLINTFYHRELKSAFPLKLDGNVEEYVPFFPSNDINVQKLTLNKEYKYTPFYQNLKTLVQVVKADSSEVVLVTNPFNRNFYSSDKFNADWEHYKSFVQVYNDIIRYLASKEECQLIDLASANIDDDNWIDDCHLNAEGHKEVYEFMIQYDDVWEIPVD